MFTPTVYHPYYVDAIAVRYDASGTKHYYLQDANFNVTAVANDTGTVLERYAYTPYGEVTVLDADFSADADGKSDISNEHLYTGRRLDPETGLQYSRARYYHPGLGRFISRDPLGYVSPSLYNYVNNRPLDFTDPSGLRHLKPPATPAKCAEAIGLMMAYASFMRGRTYDFQLLKHYIEGTGQPLRLPIDAFDPDGSHRADLAQQLFNALPNKPANFNGIPCGGRTFVGANTISKRYTNNVTLMISSYTLTGTSNFWYRKSCLFGYCGCYIDFTILFRARDRTDFNPGDVFGFAFKGIEYLIDDQLILDCGIGNAFDITGNSVESGTWLTDCNNP